MQELQFEDFGENPLNIDRILIFTEIPLVLLEIDFVQFRQGFLSDFGIERV